MKHLIVILALLTSPVAADQVCYYDQDWNLVCGQPCMPYSEYAGFACFDGVSDCHRITTTQWCDGTSTTSWGNAAYYTYLTTVSYSWEYVSGDIVMTHVANGVADRWYVIGFEDPNTVADFGSDWQVSIIP